MALKCSHPGVQLQISYNTYLETCQICLNVCLKQTLHADTAQTNIELKHSCLVIAQ